MNLLSYIAHDLTLVVLIPKMRSTTPRKLNKGTTKEHQAPHAEKLGGEQLFTSGRRKCGTHMREHICRWLRRLEKVTYLDNDIIQGVLTIPVHSIKVYVCNTQTPNRQIWLRTPF